ncbi:MAG: thioredoxin TrxC [Pseudomonadota bacterium]
MSQIISLCSHCFAKNRLDAERINDKPKCGACHKPLLGNSVVAANDKQFSQLMANEELPMVVDFWAPWCGPCRSFAPTFESVSKQFSGVAKFVKVNTEQAQQTAGAMRIRSIPTLMIIHKGKVLTQQAGAAPAAMFEQWVRQSLPKG